jgi:hypothetical protein
METFYLILADAILVLHMALVLFNLLAFVFVWIGYFARWGWVRNFYFRVAHLGCMGFIAIQTVMGADCPLTVWENNLRVRAGVAPQYEETFVGHWLGDLLFYEAGLGTFAVIYTLFFLLIVFTWIKVKPNWPRWRKAAKSVHA